MPGGWVLTCALSYEHVRTEMKIMVEDEMVEEKEEKDEEKEEENAIKKALLS